MPDLEEDRPSSPGWTDRGDMQSQQQSANEYNKAAQEVTDRKQAYLDSMAEKLGPSQPDRGQDRSQAMERTIER